MTEELRATPVLLWSRAALLAVVVVVVSVLGHVAADGLLPGLFALALLTAGTTVVAARLLTHRASGLRLVLMLAVGQAVVHGFLSLLAGHGTRPASTPTRQFAFDGRATERTGSYLDQVAGMQRPVAGSASDGGGLGHLVEHLAQQSPGMLAGHAAAVVLLGAWLAVGERALWTVLGLMTSRVLLTVAQLLAGALGGLLPALTGPVRRTPVLRSTRRTAVPALHLLRHVVAHRGPPALLSA